MLVNRGDGTFTEAAAPYGLDSLSDGRGLAISDFDGDGDLDLVVNNYNGRAQYFVNQVADGHWLRVRLRGRENNRDGVGAIVRITSGDQQQMRIVTAGESYASQHSRVIHLGLGEASVVDRLEVTWPLGQRQEFVAVAADRLIEIDEASHEVRTVRGARVVQDLERVTPPGSVCLVKER